MSDGAWLQNPCWVVVVVESRGRWHYAGYYRTRKEAARRAKRMPKAKPFPKAFVLKLQEHI